MSAAAAADFSQLMTAPPPPAQHSLPPPTLPPHLVTYLSSPSVTAFLSSLACHFPSYAADELLSLFATLLAARYRHSPSCTSQLQWTQKYAPTSVHELWSHGAQTATLRQYTESLAAVAASATMPSLLLVGPSSSSKTAAAYAIASTLQSAVIEVHPGMARSGRDIQALCGEATQSHRLHGDRMDVWAVVKEERWRNWEKSQRHKKEEQRESEADECVEQHTSSAKRVHRNKQSTSSGRAQSLPRRPRKQQQAVEREQSELDAASDADLPERLVIRLKMRSNNRARLLSCPSVPLPPAQPQPTSKRKGRQTEQKNGTIATFFTHPTVDNGLKTAAVEQEQAEAEAEDDVVIERTEAAAGDSSSGKREREHGNKKGKRKPKVIGDFFNFTTTASNKQTERHDNADEQSQRDSTHPPKDDERVESKELTVGGGCKKKRRKGKRAAAGIGSFFAATTNAVEDNMEHEEETKEQPTAATSKRSDDSPNNEQDAVMEHTAEQKTAPPECEAVSKAEDDSKRKVQKGIGGFFGGKSEVVRPDSVDGKRRGRKSKRAATPIDLTSPPASARHSPPTPPSPPPTAPYSSAVSASSAALPSSSLILFEDVDLVFAADVHFHRTLRSLVLAAKRPLLLTAQCVPSWVDEVGDDKLRIVQMARMGEQECVLHALLICAVETGVDDSGGSGKGWNCMDVARLCCWWQYDVRRVLMTLQVLVATRDTLAFSSEALLDESLLASSSSAIPLLAPSPTVSSPSSLLMSVVGLSTVSSSLLSTFSTMHPSSFALLCSSSSSVDLTHLNWPSSVQRRALTVMQRLPLCEAQCTASVADMVSLEDVPADCVHVLIEGQKHDTNSMVEAEPAAQPNGSLGESDAVREASYETVDSTEHMSQQSEEAEFGSSRRSVNERKIIAEDDEEYVHDVEEPVQSDNERLDSDVILVEPPSPLVDPKLQHDAFLLRIRHMACQQLRQRESEHRLAYAASTSPSLAQQLACRFLESVASLSSLLADCNLLSAVRLLPLSSTVPSSLLYQSHPSLPPHFIDVNVPYSGSSYRCAVWWLTGDKDGLRGEMDEGRRDEQPMCEEMFDELKALMEHMALTDMRAAVERLDSDVSDKTAVELTQRQKGRVPPPRRTPLGRQHGSIEVVVSADTVPAHIVLPDSAPPFQSSEPVVATTVDVDSSASLSASAVDGPFALELASPRLPLISSPAARRSAIDASKALFSSLRCKLHAPTSRTWLTDVYPFLCQMGVVEGQREDERRAEEKKSREESNRVAEERRVRRQAQREARQVKRKEKKRARKERRKRKRLQRNLNATTSSSSSSTSSSNSSSDDSSSSHTSGSSGDDDDVSIDSDERDFFAPRRSSRRRHSSSRRVAAAAAREELHVCGGLSDELYEEVMAALRLPRWRDWTDD